MCSFFYVFFFQVSDSLSLSNSLSFCLLHVRLLRALIKINQSINQLKNTRFSCSDSQRDVWRQSIF